MTALTEQLRWTRQELEIARAEIGRLREQNHAIHLEIDRRRSFVESILRDHGWFDQCVGSGCIEWVHLDGDGEDAECDGFIAIPTRWSVRWETLMEEAEREAYRIAGEAR